MVSLEKKVIIEKIFLQSSNLIKESITLIPEIEKTLQIIINCIKNGNKIIVFGNGGSAADAQHIAAEFIGKFQKDRSSFPAIALTTDSSIITSVGNDFSFDNIFSRQCEGLASKDDVVIGISTSGNSQNIVNGLITSQKIGCKTLGFLGNDGGKIKNLVDVAVIVNSKSTPRIQEVHRIIFHIICDLVEQDLTN
jgi:D-sedoheptulose 7-phosphate isomerase